MMGYDDRRIRNFRTKVGPNIRDYVYENGPSTIVGIVTAGRLFALELYQYLLKAGPNDPYVDVKYFETDKNNILETFKINRDIIEGRNVIMVDDDIHTRQTFEEVQKQLQQIEKRYKIRTIKWAVEYDGPGVASWSCNRNGSKNNTNEKETFLMVESKNA